MTLGEQIKKIRKKKGLTQKQLGLLCGKTKQGIYAIESGRCHLSDKEKERLAKILNCKVTILFEERV